MNTKKGFTILEIIVVACFATLLLIIFFIQKSNIDAMERDKQRKIAINAMYYALEESFYKEHGYYPEFISEENIKVIDPALWPILSCSDGLSIDPALWTDPLGYNLGSPQGSYFYEAVNCKDGKCKEYILKANLEKEDVYAKYNRN